MTKITIDELSNKLIEKFEARQKEKADKEAAELEAKKKAETEAKSSDIDLDELVDKIGEKMALKTQKIEAAKEEEKQKEQGNFNIGGKYKLDRDTQMLADAVMSKNIPGDGFKLAFKLDVNEGEDRLRSMYLQASKEGKKADLDGASSYGSQLLTEDWGTDLYMRMADLDGELFKYFPKVQMTSYKQHISELLADITVSAYSSYQDRAKAIETVTATSPTTADLALEAKTFVAKTNIYNLLTDDAKVNLLRGLRQKMAMKINSKVSAAAINGDTTATHMDEDLEAAGAYIPEAMFKGLRKYIMAGSLGVDGTDAAYTLADLDSVRAMMGKYNIGVNRKSCKWIFGVKSIKKLTGLLRAQTAAPNAADYVIRNGEVEEYEGHGIIVSEHQREDLEIDGYADSTGTDGNQGFIALVNTNQFVFGVRNQLMIEVVPDPLNGRRVVQGTIMLDFEPFETPSTTISCAAGLYGFTV
jgi:HK97 family phage major capsid protein